MQFRPLPAQAEQASLRKHSDSLLLQFRSLLLEDPRANVSWARLSPELHLHPTFFASSPFCHLQLFFFQHHCSPAGSSLKHSTTREQRQKFGFSPVNYALLPTINNERATGEPAVFRPPSARATSSVVCFQEGPRHLQPLAERSTSIALLLADIVAPPSSSTLFPPPPVVG